MLFCFIGFVIGAGAGAELDTKRGKVEVWILAVIANGRHILATDNYPIGSKKENAFQPSDLSSNPPWDIVAHHQNIRWSENL